MFSESWLNTSNIVDPIKHEYFVFALSQGNYSILMIGFFKGLQNMKAALDFYHISSLPRISNISLIKANPAPKSILGTPEYYRFRHNDFIQRLGNEVALSPPVYYLEYGDKYAHKFTELKKRLSEKGKQWVDQTLLLLQIKLEQLLKKNTYQGIELNNNLLLDVVYGQHPEAYIESGLFELERKDMHKIFKAIESTDKWCRRGIKQIVHVIIGYFMHLGKALIF